MAAASRSRTLSSRCASAFSPAACLFYRLLALTGTTRPPRIPRLATGRAAGRERV